MTAALLLLSGALLAQGVTTSSMNGQITDESGEPLIGANVVAIHVPTGTMYGNSTNVNGIYRIPYMMVGGPYRITVSYTGFEDRVEENIYLTLGQSYKFDAVLAETAIEIQGVEVVATRTDIFDGNRTGQETVIEERVINNTPTLTRALQDYVRFNPLASVSEGDDGFSVSLAGQNNRFNTIYIDGAVNNDAFGLAGSGTNGGQTGVQPISIDAIEQFTVSIAPFDVRQSGFAGGSVSAVTRSGTNELKGSAYYFFRNESLAGKRITTDERLSDFSAKTYGLRLGGPIVKDKLFFFVNAELQRDDTPQPFNFDNYIGAADLNQVEQLRNQVQEQYGYELGNFDENTRYLESDKFLAKINWNINQNHKLSLRHSFVKAENLEARNSDFNSISFINGSEFFTSTTNSTALELSSLFGSTISNKLTVGATIVRDDRDPFGDPFPTVELQDEEGDFTFGAERFSTANLLNQDIITINDDLTIYAGRHSLLFGANFEYFNAGNLFIRNNFGRYRWFDDGDLTGVDRFLAGDPADRYERSFSQVDNVTGDESAAIAQFEQMLIGFYVQDEFQATNNLKFTAGLRLDFPVWPTDQPVNEDFNSKTIPDIESFGYDMQGASTGSFISTQALFSPRLGFNWDLAGDKITQIRGGAGIFTSRIPLVWPGGAYNNYGFNIGEFGARDVDFIADVNNQPPEVDLEDPTPSGQVDLFSEKFKLPQVFKANLAIDRKLPWGLIGTLEGIYTKHINNIRYQNFNLKPSDRNLVGADDRPLFRGTQAAFGDDVIDPTYTYIMLSSNTDKGYAFNFAATLTKPFTNGFQASLSYSYSDAYTVFDLGSSQNNSQWRGYYNVQGRNFVVDDPMRSDFAAGHRIFGQFSYGLEYGGFAKSSLSLNINGQTGGYYSYVVGARNFRFINDGGFDNNELVYVPNNQSEITLVETTVGGQTYSPEQQWNILNGYIENNAHLSERRGDYAQRNGARQPFEFAMDLRFLQDFYIETASGKRNTLQFSVDIFNFTNLLNRDWGRRRFAGSFGAFRLLELENNTLGDAPTPEYSVSSKILQGEDPWTDNIDEFGFRSSIWQMQLGVRYIFN